MDFPDVRELDTDQLRKGRVDLIHAIFGAQQNEAYHYNMKMLTMYEIELLSRYAEGLLSG